MQCHAPIGEQEKIILRASVAFDLAEREPHKGTKPYDPKPFQGQTIFQVPSGFCVHWHKGLQFGFELNDANGPASGLCTKSVSLIKFECVGA
jgi:hypothetical protein